MFRILDPVKINPVSGSQIQWEKHTGSGPTTLLRLFLFVVFLVFLLLLAQTKLNEGCHSVKYRTYKLWQLVAVFIKNKYFCSCNFNSYRPYAYRSKTAGTFGRDSAATTLSITCKFG
jgi:hypothetical protein